MKVPMTRSLALSSMLSLCWLVAAPAVAQPQAQTPPAAEAPEAPQADAAATPAPAAEPRPQLLPVPAADLEGLEPAVAEQLAEYRELLEGLLADDGSDPAQLANAFGELGRLYHVYNLDRAAEACYENARRLAPQDYRWPYYLGNVRERMGDLDGAADAFARALTLDTSKLAALVHLGEVYLAQNRLGEARLMLTRALALDHESAAVHAALGQVALSEGDARQAVEELTMALEAVPEANRLHYPLGLAYRKLGEMEKAREHLAQRGEVGVRPNDPLMDELETLKAGERVHILRGQIAYRAGSYQQAIEEFKKAVEAAPDSISGHVNLGSALGQMGDVVGAIAEYRKVLEIAPDNTAAHYNLGVLLLQRGSLDEAAEHLLAVVDSNPEDATATLALASTLARAGRKEEALPYYQAAVRLAPATERAWLDGAQVLVDLGRYRQARGVLEQARATLPTSGPVARSLALLLAAAPDLSVRDGAKAVELAQQVLQAQPTVGHAVTLALALAEADRCDEAAEVQRQALDTSRQAAGSQPIDPNLTAALERYENERPCRLPGAGGDS